MIYLGQRPPSAPSPTEPDVIYPDLPVSASARRYVGSDSGPGLAYHLLSPVARKAYLDWQAGGRRTEVAPGLVLLFCVGLERRVLVDGDDDPAVHRELPALAAEVRRLRIRYGDGGTSLRQALDHLLDLLDLLTARRDAPAPGPDRETPMAVRIALARFAVSSTPVPVAWARAWLRHHPSLTPSRSESDCPAEFERLFTLRYRDRYGNGLVAAGGGAGIRLRYHPANPGLATTLVWRADLPDLLSERRDLRALAALRGEVAAALDPYRRWLVRFPHGRDSLAAVPLLPAELVDSRHGRLGAVRVWSERRLDGQQRALIDAGEFWDFWSAASPQRMAADEAATLLAVLAKLDLGVEPDVRFGAPPLAPGPAVLFRLGRPAADRPGTHFASGAAIVRCAAAVASAAGPIDPREAAGTALLATAAELAAALRLAPGEDLRLAARLSWLLTTRVDVERLGRLTTMLTAAEREVAGHYLVTVAVAADPVIGPATVSVLTRVYRILGLQVDLVFGRLHERSTAGAPVLPRIAGADGPPVPAGRRASRAGVDAAGHHAPGVEAAGHHAPGVEAAGHHAPGVDRPDEPVVVQTGGRQPSGYALPWTPPAEPPPAEPTAEPPPAEPPSSGAATPPTGFRLDRSLIRRKVAESGTAAALLSTIFEAEEPVGDPEPPVTVPGLDRAHDALLHALGERPSWTRAEFDSLAAAHGVMPDGALDLLNEVAIDTAGEPLVEGSATLTVANDVLRELLA